MRCSCAGLPTLPATPLTVQLQQLEHWWCCMWSTALRNSGCHSQRLPGDTFQAVRIQGQAGGPTQCSTHHLVAVRGPYKVRDPIWPICAKASPELHTAGWVIPLYLLSGVQKQVLHFWYLLHCCCYYYCLVVTGLHSAINVASTLQ